MKGKVFEKVGVNVSTVRGTFSEQFANQVNGASVEHPEFTATGISLVSLISFARNFSLRTASTL